MIEVIVIICCLLLNALLAAFEMAFVSVPKSDLRKLSKEGNHEAQRLLNLRQEPERTLSVIQIGISLVGGISAAVGGAKVTEKFVPYLMMTFDWSKTTSSILAILFFVLPLTYVTVIGELVPKTLALRHSLRISLFGSRWIAIADRIFDPFVNILESSTKMILKLFFAKSKSQPSMTEQVDIDNVSRGHQQHILNLAQLETRKIGAMVVPWEKVNILQVSQPVTEVSHCVFTSGHTRLPVLENNQVIGILHTKEFLALRESGNDNWKSIIRPILKIRDVNTALEVLKRMQTSQSHMAVVYTIYDERLGIVTLEDINEEIWGEIYDEDDDHRIKKLYGASVKGRVLPKA